MSLSMGQITLTNTGTQFGVLTPGGSVTMMSVTAASTIYVGQLAGTLLTSSNGFPLVTGQPPVTFTLPPTSQPAVMYGLSSGTTVLGYAFTSNS